MLFEGWALGSRVAWILIVVTIAIITTIYNYYSYSEVILYNLLFTVAIYCYYHHS